MPSRKPAVASVQQTLQQIRLEASRLAVKAEELYEAERRRQGEDMPLESLAEWLESLADALNDAVHYSAGALKELR